MAKLTERLEAHLHEKTTADWEAILVAVGVPCAGLQTCAEFFVDPQVEAMAMNPVIEHARMGRLRLAGVPVHFSETPGSIQRAAPMHGEHADEILADLGYDRARVDNLRGGGIVK